MTTSDIWQKACEHIKEKIGSNAFETWFSALHAVEEDQTLFLETPDDFFKNWIVDHYLKIIEEAMVSVGANGICLAVRVGSEITKPLATSQIKITKEEITQKISPEINPRFSFENFVIGPSNRFACAASQAVAESPAKAYNPLFIYGQVGLGKTHLMQAIVNKLKESNPQLKYTYLSSERFTNELINAIRNRSTDDFRKKYRNIDVLLIDDIHFIAGKESTQEEFFHTFNALHENRKQIIISSDRPPREISNLEERLTSRFAWGLITDIQPPDFETRVAILRKKLEQEPSQVPDEVIFYIAEQIKTNIRELEGALIRVIAYSLLEEKTISLEQARLILKDMIKEAAKAITVEQIQKIVADFYNISIADLKAVRRNKTVVLPRQISMYLTRQLTQLSLPEIGQAFGGKDHTTVLHSFKKIEKDIQADRDLKNTIERLTTSIKQ